MKEFLDFIKEYWQIVAFVILGLLNVLLLILKKKPKVYGWYLDCINLVKQAESMFFGSGRGIEKLDYVISNFISAHDLTNNEFNKTMVKAMVEKILSCPSKKEVANEKTNEKVS